MGVTMTCERAPASDQLPKIWNLPDPSVYSAALTFSRYPAQDVNCRGAVNVVPLIIKGAPVGCDAKRHRHELRLKILTGHPFAPVRSSR